MFCITDASVSQLKFEAENFAFFQVFEDVIIAEQVGLNKDDPEIYNFTCKKHSLLPEKTLFIDDRISNIAAASKIGVKTIKY